MRNKITLTLSLISLLALILYLVITHFTTESPGGTKTICYADNPKAAASMNTAIQGLADQLLREFPEDPGLALAAFTIYKQSNHLQKVVDILENGLKYNPESFDLNYVMSRVSFGTGHYEKAATFGYKALAIEPTDPLVHENLGDSLILSGEYKQAIEVLKERIRLFGGSARSYELLGNGYSLLMDYEKAKEYYEKAFQKEPRLKRSHISNMAKIHMKLKQPEEARKYLKMHTEITDEQREQELENARKNNYQVVFQSSNSELRDFSRSLTELCIQGTGLYHKRGDMKGAQQLFDKACVIFEKTIAIAPDNAVIYQEFAMLHVKTNVGPAQAQRLAKKAVAVEASALSYYVLGQAYSSNSNSKKAILAYEQALKKEPENMTIKQAYDSLIEKR